jgi:oligopeptide/dipeptide ABC transporter ATP-binding protein
MEQSDVILDVKNLSVSFSTPSGRISVVESINFDLAKGEVLGIVGESGSGKSVTALSLLRLLTGTTGRIDSGEVLFNGTNLLNLSDEEMRNIRGNNIAMIFQDPMTSLNPVLRIQDQIIESIMIHKKVGRVEAIEQTIGVLKSVNLSSSKRTRTGFPFQFSGGQRQRMMIALGVVCEPSILIADEPTTALDVTIQAQILELMDRLRQDTGASIILITHDLGVIAEMCDRVVVMYCGRIVEKGSIFDLFDNPANPYTQGLLASIPKLGVRTDKLESIPGNVPNPSYFPKGCKFCPRCKYATDICRSEEPEFYEINPWHYSKCWLHDKAQKEQEK